MNAISMISLERAVPVRWRPPFGPAVPYRDLRPAGETLLEIARSVPDLPDVFFRRGTICINSEPMERQYWHLIRPKPGTAEIPIIVTLHLPLLGGGGSSSGGSGKQVIAIVAAIALTVATVGIGSGFILGGASAALGGALGLTAAQGAAILAGTVGALGSLALGALTPPPALAGTVDDTTPDRGPASASGNALSQNAAIPRVVGTSRVFPPFACEPLIELVGDDEIVEAITILNGPHALSDVRFGNVPVAAMQDLSLETRVGWDDDTAITLVQRQGRTTAPNLELSSHIVNPSAQRSLSHQVTPNDDIPLWHQVVTRDSPDEAWLNFNLPSGLCDSADATQPIVIPVRPRMRRRGTSTWINLPELHIADTTGKQLRRAIVLKWTSAAAPPTIPYLQQGWIRAVTHVASQWDANSYFVGTGSQDYLDITTGSSKVRKTAVYYNKVEFYLDPATFTPGVWEIEIQRGCAFRATDFAASTYQYNGTAWNFFTYAFTGSAFQIAESREGLTDVIYLLRVASVWNQHPIHAPFAIVAVKARNRQLAALSVLASGYVKDWDGSGWNYWTTTSNPAPHYVDVLSGNLNARPLLAELRDDPGLVTWRQECSDHGWTVDTIIDDLRTDDALQLIASCGYARRYQSELYGAAVDRDTDGEVPIQIFSSRNSGGLSYAKAFSVTADGFVVSFRNQAKDYEPDQITVYRTGYVDDGNALLEQANYDGIVDAAKVEVRARFDLDQIRLRGTFYSLRVDREAIQCRRSELVGVNFDVLQEMSGSAYVKSVINNSDGEIEWLVLDQTVILAGEGFGVAIRREDGTVTTHPLANVAGETDELELADPIEGTTAIVALDETERRRGTLITVGLIGQEYQRFKVSSIDPDKNLQFSLTLVDEAPSLVRTVS